MTFAVFALGLLAGCFQSALISEEDPKNPIQLAWKVVFPDEDEAPKSWTPADQAVWFHTPLNSYLISTVDGNVIETREGGLEGLDRMIRSPLYSKFGAPQTSWVGILKDIQVSGNLRLVILRSDRGHWLAGLKEGSPLELLWLEAPGRSPTSFDLNALAIDRDAGRVCIVDYRGRQPRTKEGFRIRLVDVMTGELRDVAIVKDQTVLAMALQQEELILLSVSIDARWVAHPRIIHVDVKTGEVKSKSVRGNGATGELDPDPFSIDDRIALSASHVYFQYLECSTSTEEAYRLSLCKTHIATGQVAWHREFPVRNSLSVRSPGGSSWQQGPIRMEGIIWTVVPERKGENRYLLIGVDEATGETRYSRSFGQVFKRGGFRPYGAMAAQGMFAMPTGKSLLVYIGEGLLYKFVLPSGR